MEDAGQANRDQLICACSARMFLITEGVDNGDGGGLYTPHTVRRRLGAMTRLRSSSLILGDQPPILIGGLGFDGSPGDPGRGSS